MLKTNKIYNMGVREGLTKLEPESIDCVITSPPYWSLRDYGIPASVWGGDPECQHEFEIKIKEINPKPSDKSTLGYRANGEYSFGKEGSPYLNNLKQTEYKEGFCSKCGAWNGTLGLEPNFELFIQHLCDIYDGVKRVLKKSGTCWVNLGDTYSNGINGIKPKCLMMLPQRFAIEMINPNWVLREDLSKEEKEFVINKLIKKGIPRRI